MVSNGFILVYKDILNILNRDSTNGITNNRRKGFIEFKDFFRSLNWPSSLCLSKQSFAVSKIFWFIFNQRTLKFYIVFVRKCYTHILFTFVSEENLFPSFKTYYRAFFSSSEILLFVNLPCFLLGAFLSIVYIPNTIHYNITIWNYWFIDYFPLFNPEIIIFLLKNDSNVSSNKVSK